MAKRCRVVCDTDAGIRECELTLPDQADIQAALQAARVLLGEAILDWDRAATGIYGRAHQRSHVPVDGDRIELYRPLPVDPRQARRERVRTATSKRKRR
jgi:putative ubiquitin-RnfH superfamily antitoxin RatB of RatAB toxin-antitoxin module